MNTTFAGDILKGDIIKEDIHAQTRKVASIEQCATDRHNVHIEFVTGIRWCIHRETVLFRLTQPKSKSDVSVSAKRRRSGLTRTMRAARKDRVS